MSDLPASDLPSPASPRFPSRWRLLRRIAIGAVVFAAAWTGLVGHWLPGWLRPQVEAAATEALGTPVRLGGLAIAPWRLVLTAKDLSVGPTERPWLKLRQGEVGLSIESVWRLAPVIRRVDLVAPELDIERLSAERFNFSPMLDRLQQAPSEPRSDGGPARFAVFNVRLSEGVIRYRDLVLDQSHRVDGIRLEVPFLSSLPSHVEAQVQPLLEARIDGSLLRVAGRTQPFHAGLKSEVDVRWRDVDLAHWLTVARPLLPEPWRPVARAGRLDTDLQIAFEQRPAPAPAVLAVRGRLGVKALDLSLPSVPGAGALDAGWQQLELGGLDLQPFARRVALREVALDGLAVKLRPSGAAASRSPSSQSQSQSQSASAKSPDPAASSASSPAAAPPAGGWAWSVAKLRVGLRDIDVQTLAAPWPRLTEGEIGVQGLDGGDRAQPARWTLALADEHGGRIAAQGRLHAGQQTAEAELQVNRWSLPAWLVPVQAQGLLPASVAAGTLDLNTRLQIHARPSPTGQPPSLRVDGGRVLAEGAQVGLGGHGGPGAAPSGAKRIKPGTDHIGWRALLVEGVEAELGLSEAASGLQRLKIGSITADALQAEVSRDAQGRLLAAVSGADASPQRTPHRPSAPPQALPDMSIQLVQCRACAVRFTDHSVQPAAVLSVQQTDLSVQGLSQRLDQAVKLELRARAQGRGQLSFQGEVRPEPLKVNGQLSVAALDLRALQPYLDPHVNVSLSQAAALAQGRVQLDTARNGAMQARYQGRIGLQDLRLRDRVNDALLLRWASFTLDRTDLSWRDGAIDADLGFIALKDFYGRIIVNRDGSLNLASIVRRQGDAAETSVTTPQLAPQSGVPASASASAPAAIAVTPATPSAASASPPVVAAASSSPKPRLRWQGIHLEKGEVDFTDTFIQPNYSAHLTKLAGDISAVSSAQPEPAKVEVNAALDDGAPVRISGQLHPLGPQLFTDIQGVAKGIELSRLTPYAARYAGYPIEKGTLSVNVHYRVDGGKLQADNQVFLDQLTFGERVDSPDATKLPVLLAVSLLKNARGEIDINLPISGSLDDPQFSIGGIIWRVVVNLLTKAVLAPFSLLSGDGGGELGSVPFPPGQADLDEAARARLDKLAATLKDRPALKLEATGWADADVDREGLRQAHVMALMKRSKAKAQGLDADEVDIAPGERSTWLKAAYQAADIKKPRNFIGLAQSLPDEEMASLLKASARVDTAALQALADDRANGVKAYLSERLDPERVRLTASRVGTEGKVDEKSGGSSVQFQLK